jgi:hypothetical protein
VPWRRDKRDNHMNGSSVLNEDGGGGADPT